MSKLLQTQKKIETAVVGGYKAVETGVVSGYKAVENGVVSGYKKIEDKFVHTFLTPAEDTDNEKEKNNE
jgi:hypothetical protein